jgi:hypothetical protein
MIKALWKKDYDAQIEEIDRLKQWNRNLEDESRELRIENKAVREREKTGRFAMVAVTFMIWFMVALLVIRKLTNRY